MTIKATENHVEKAVSRDRYIRDWTAHIDQLVIMLPLSSEYDSAYVEIKDMQSRLKEIMKECALEVENES